MFLIDFMDEGDTARPTITLCVEGEVIGPDQVGGYAIGGITSIYAAVTQVDTAANDRAPYVVEKMQDACWHQSLYLPASWRITLIRETGLAIGEECNETDRCSGHVGTCSHGF